MNEDLNPDDRPETELVDCLLQADIKYPQDAIVYCGLCPNRSSDRGNLGDLCVRAKQK